MEMDRDIWIINQAKITELQMMILASTYILY